MTLAVGRLAAWARTAGWMGLVLLVTACATPRQPEARDGESAWAGRLALRVDTEPVQSVSGGFTLQGSPAEGTLLLTSPLGTAVASVNWSSEKAQWRQGDQVITKATLDELTRELGGSALPVAALFAWLRGQSLEADGWAADLSRHAEGRITARRTHPLPSAELRLIVQP
jgi:outer membrane lipoprotein LolB